MFVTVAIGGVTGPAQRTLRAGHVVAAVAGGGAVGVLETGQGGVHHVDPGAGLGT